jgi:hypothetical protein
VLLSGDSMARRCFRRMTVHRRAAPPGPSAPVRPQRSPHLPLDRLRIVVRMATFSEHLRGRSDDELVDLLLRRPDLAHPSPATLTSLAARATSRPSLERALAGVDAAVLQAVESVVALLDGSGPGDGVRARDVAAAVGASARGDVADVRAALGTATALALLHPVGGRATDPLLRPAPGLAELLGPYPAGLAPTAAGTGASGARTAAGHLDAAADRATGGAGARPAATGPSVPVPSAPADAAPDLAAALAATATAGRAVLDALTWGPPIGVLPTAGPAAEAVADLVARGLLLRPDGRHVLLPRAVALALRDGRTHPAPARPPLGTEAPRRDAGLVAAEQAAAAERAVRLVATLVRAWERTAPPVLRAGGLGVRDLRRSAQTLEVTEQEAALVAELAWTGGLVRDDGEERPAYQPTTAFDEWSALDLPRRWARLVGWWAGSTRAAWLVGERDDRGLVRAALGTEVVRPWAPRLRRAVLGVLAAAPEGAVPDAAPEGVVLDADAVVAALTWRTPRAVPPADAVAAVLREAAWLGLTGAGALAAAGHALLADGADPAPDVRDPETEQALAAALEAALPAAVDDLLLQGDLTGIVPGRPSTGLEALIDATALVESRGGAVTVRFTPESVRGALDAGATADALLADLARHARGGVPQPLEYLVRDAARRHGRVRGGSVASYVRTEDPALLAGLAEDPRHAGLGLVRLAPTVLAAQAPLAELLAALRAHGLAPVAETPDGQVLHAAPVVHRIAALRRRPGEDTAGTRGAVPPADRAAALVGVLRRAEEARSQPAAGGASTPTGRPPVPDAGAGRGTADPGEALGLLREAAAEHAEVWLELVGSRGSLERRRVRPVHVEAGRVRVVDTARDAEIVVAAHRVASVTRIAPPPTDDLLPTTPLVPGRAPA